MMDNRGVLVLKDGTVIEGEGFGAMGESKGELVFNTSMTGYQESLTDPSYKYQILMLTQPLIGNYGVIKEHSESDRVQVEGLIIRELAKKAFHGKMEKGLDRFMEENGVPCLHGVDTRFLTRKIREFGVINAVLKWPATDTDVEEMKARAEGMDSISERDLVSLVTTKGFRIHDIGGDKTVVMIDCGVKRSIMNSLLERKVNVVQVPASATADEILGYDPQGVVISNGPGDPERADYVIKTVEGLMGHLPMFGICLGQQLIALAAGGSTFKLKFGHRGSNQPVKDLRTGRVYITSQNHGFAVDKDSLGGTDFEISHLNLNDGSVEGLSSERLGVRAVQYHPEAHPGPWDSRHLFDEFLELVK
jgi:carbamoyl-phosphate synthase small subunit